MMLERLKEYIIKSIIGGKKKMEEKPEYIEAGDLRPSSSFELKKTTKGVNIRVKIYACDDSDKISHAMDEAMARFDKLLEKYGVE